MAPEQLEGREVDARTDIFALGALLYEMATGRRAFAGASQAALVLAIQSSEPPAISKIQPLAPASLDRVVGACLAKDPEDRWQNAADVGKELKWLAEGSGAGAVAPVAARRVKRELFAWAAAALAVLVAGVAWLSRGTTAPDELIRFTIAPPPGQSFADRIWLAPDGRRALFLLEDPGGSTSIWVRSLDTLGARRLPGSDNAHAPFWSPDGREIAFFSEGKLRRIGAEGGPARTVCDSGGWGLGGSWSRQGTILFTPEFGTGIVAVPAAGGTPRLVTTLETARGDAAHLSPEFLPDGRHFLFVARNLDPEKTEIRVGSLDAKEVLSLCHAHSAATYAQSGHLLFARDNALLAWRFDPGRLRLVGEPTPLFEDVRYETANNRLTLTAAGNRVAYLRWSLQRRLVWVDRKGRELGTLGSVRGYEDVRVSPDGRRLAVTVRDPAHGQNLDVWVLDVARGTGTRVTAEPTDEFNPAWFPDGERLVYASDHAGFYGLYERPASGGPEKVLLRTGHDEVLPTVSADGRFLMCQDLAKASASLRLLPLPGAGEGRQVGEGPAFFEGQPEISPDGRWSAFVSNESGQREVYMEPLPVGPKIQLSVGGGEMPIWRRDGRELFYVAKDGMLTSVAIRQQGARPAVGDPQPLFPIRYVVSGPEPAQRPYDVAPDGERFVVIRRAPDVEPDDAVFVVNWTRALLGAR
jgi:Tol biopolymer transport system component